MSYIIGTAGHVDHGKTTLTKLLTNIETDRLAEEKKRGLSIELGFAYFDIDDLGRVGVIDVPGHEKFISNMLKGVSSFDLVLFCIALDDSIMPQTIDHFNIVKLLNIKNVIFLLTKRDLVDDERVTVVKDDLNKLRKNTMYEKSLVLEISHDNIITIDSLKNEIEKILRSEKEEETAIESRFPIDRVFTVKGHGQVVTGSMIEGEITTNEKLYLYGMKGEVTIRSIERHGLDVLVIKKGERGALNIKSSSNYNIEKGDLLINEHLYDKIKDLKFKNDIDVEIEFADKIGSNEKEIKKRQNITIYFQTLKRKANLTLQKVEGENNKYYGKLKIEGKLPLLLRDDILILRDNGTGRIMGSAKVLINNIESLQSRKLKNIDYNKLQNNNNLFSYLLSDNLYLSSDDLLFLLNIDSIDIYDCKQIDKYVMLIESFENLKNNIIKILKEFIEVNKEVKGIKIDELSRKLSLNENDLEFLNLFLNSIEEEKLIIRKDSFISLSGLNLALNESDEKIVIEINKLFTLSETVYIKEDDIFKLPYHKDKLKKIITYMTDNELLYRITKNSFIDSKIYDKARSFTVEFINKSGSIEVKDLRDELKIGRKVCIEILEFFDKIGITIRKDNKRVLR